MHEHEMLAGWSTMILLFHEAEQILDEFRGRFIQDMDSEAVVLDLLHYDIISEGDLRTIRRTMNRIQQNSFLHFYLKSKCTEDSLHIVCDIISSVMGNARMRALGIDMRRRLEIGIGVTAGVMLRIYIHMQFCRPNFNGGWQCIIPWESGCRFDLTCVMGYGSSL